MKLVFLETPLFTRFLGHYLTERELSGTAARVDGESGTG
jgi:hypothetical protein